MVNFNKIKERWRTGSTRLKKKVISENMFDINPAKYRSYYNLNEFDLFLLRPNIINNQIKDIKINDTYFRILFIAGFPSEVTHGFIDELIRSDVNFDTVQSIKPVKRSDKIKELEKSLTNTRLSEYEVREKGQFSASLEFKEQSQLTAMRKLTRGQEKAFKFGLAVAVKSNNRDDLDLETKKVQDVLDGMSLDTKVFEFYQEDGLRSFMPNNDFDIKTKDMLTNSVSAFFPFTESFFDNDKDGVILGININTQIPIIMDIFKLPNSNGVVVGTSGSGKSFTVKSIAIRYAQRGYHLYIIDPNNEYEFLVKVLGGQYIKLHPKSESMLNPLDLMGHNRDDKIENLRVFIKILIPVITDQQWGVFRDTCEEVYEDFGIKRDFNSKNDPDKIMPTLKDVYNKLRDKINKIISDQKKSPPIEFYKLINHLKPFSYGAYDYLSRQTSINWSSDIICFAIEGMTETVSGGLMFLVLDLINNKMAEFKAQQNSTKLREQFSNIKDVKELRKLKDKLDNEEIVRGFIIVDEAWLVLDRAGGEYIKWFAKVIRKYGLSIIVISQEVRDLMGSDGGKAMLSNSSFNLVLKQKPNQLVDVRSQFNLSVEEERQVESAGRGEGVLIADRDHFKFKSLLTDDEVFVAESDFRKRIDLDIKNLTALQSLYNIILENGLKDKSEEFRDKFFKLRRKENKSPSEGLEFKNLQDEVLERGKIRVGSAKAIEYEKLDYLYGKDTKTQLDEKKGMLSKPLDSIRVEILKNEFNYYEYSGLNSDELIELEEQKFSKVGFQISKKRKVEFMMRLFEFKHKDKVIDPEIIAKFEVPREQSRFLRVNPEQINHLYSYHHQSLIYLTDFLLKERGVKQIELENERIEDRPDVWWLNKNNVECVVEVESGSREYEVDGLLKKKERFDKSYGERWYILVPSQEIQRHYEKELNMKGRVIIKTQLEETIERLNYLDVDDSEFQADLGEKDV